MLVLLEKYFIVRYKWFCFILFLSFWRYISLNICSFNSSLIYFLYLIFPSFSSFFLYILPSIFFILFLSFTFPLFTIFSFLPLSSFPFHLKLLVVNLLPPYFLSVPHVLLSVTAARYLLFAHITLAFLRHCFSFLINRSIVFMSIFTSRQVRQWRDFCET